jgi:hypothetical protein
MSVTPEAKRLMFANLDDLESQLECSRIDVLSACGWKYTSDTPDSVWRWVKTLPDGRTLMVSECTALRLERAQL